MKKSVVILGGGLSGLSVAWGLAKSNYKTHIIELEPEVGGLTRSFVKNGYVFDHGPHSFYTKDPEIFYKVREAIGGEILTFGEMYSGIKIIFQGRKYNYPLKIVPVLKNMKLSVSLQCILDYFKSIFKRILSNPSNETFEDWVINNFGKTIYNNFFKSFTEKTWGISPRQLTANFASERIPKLSILKIISEIFHKNKKQKTTKMYSSKDFNPRFSYYFPKGCWQIADAIKKEIELNGGEIYLESWPKSLIVEDNSIKKVLFENKGSAKEINSDYVVSTIPIPELTKVIKLDEKSKEAGLRMKYRGLTLLFLGINKHYVFDARLVYFHDKDVLFNRATEIKFFSEKIVPSKDKTGLILEVTNKDNLSYEEIYEKSVNDLEKMGFLRKEEIETYHIIQEPYSYPIYDINYKRNLDIFMDGLLKINNLISIGRQALFRYIDMDHSIKMGLIVARHILEGSSLDEINKIVAQWS